MPRQVYVYREGLGVVPLEEAPPRENFHAVHDDSMPPTWHPQDNRVYDSRSGFRATTRALGGVEVGNDLISQRKREKPPEKPLSYEIKKHLWDQIDRVHNSRK